MLKNSTSRNSPQNLRTFFLQSDPRGTTSQNAGCCGKMFSGFGRFGLDTEFFNKIRPSCRMLRQAPWSWKSVHSAFAAHCTKVRFRELSQTLQTSLPALCCRSDLVGARSCRSKRSDDFSQVTSMVRRASPSGSALDTPSEFLIRQQYGANTAPNTVGF